MRTVHVIGLVLVFLVGLSWAETSYRIVQGKGIPGVVQLGEDNKVVIKRLGKPVKVEMATMRMYRPERWVDIPIAVAFKDFGLDTHDDGTVGAILVHSPRYKTAEGIGVGATLADVTAKYGTDFGEAYTNFSTFGGDGKRLEGLWYSERGLAFLSDQTGVVSEASTLTAAGRKAPVVAIRIDKPF